MPGGRSITVKSLELLYSLRKEIGAQNDVEFDFSIGHALVLFMFF